jgi:hypothetical protein
MIQPDPIPLTREGKLSLALRRLGRSRYAPVLLGLLALLIVGVATLTDFGASVDEDRNAEMGRLFLQAYRGENLFRSPGIEYFNGPVYFMAFTLTSRLFHSLHPSWLLTDGLHLTNFLTFLVGVFFFYRIALRLLPRGAALFATALFASQPVLFGSAFILQKDIPLMAFFLASVEVGWTAAESWRSAGQSPVDDEERLDVSVAAREEWRRQSRAGRSLIWMGGVLALLLLLDLWWIGGLRGAARGLLGEVYAGRAPAFLVEWFGRTAEDAFKTPLTAYLDRLDDLIARGRVIATLLIVAGALVVWRRVMPRAFASTMGRGFRRWGMVVIAGCVLGVTTSVRVVAPFAGVLVAAYWIGRSGRRALPALLVYAVFAMATTYLTWPVLWGDPLAALTNRGAELFGEGRSDFADHLVLFRSAWHVSGELPWEYLPTLFAVQFTLPAVILFLVGMPYSWILTSTDRDRRRIVGLVWLWFLLPVAAAIVGLVPNYDSFRHMLFCLPPAFLITGFAAWRLSDVVGSPALRTGIAAAALAPGVLGMVRLHPYEYIYFNELVGGVRGAEGKFDLDYGCTAFREAMGVVNRVADNGDVVSFQPWISTAAPFARADLQLVEGDGSEGDPDFAMACRRVVRQAFPAMETIYEVRADGALLAVVKQRRASP